MQIKICEARIEKTLVGRKSLASLKPKILKDALILLFKELPTLSCNEVSVSEDSCLLKLDQGSAMAEWLTASDFLKRHNKDDLGGFVTVDNSDIVLDASGIAFLLKSAFYYNLSHKFIPSTKEHSFDRPILECVFCGKMHFMLRIARCCHSDCVTHNIRRAFEKGYVALFNRVKK